MKTFFLILLGMLVILPAEARVPFGSDCPYPAAARDAHIEGTAGVKFHLRSNGEVDAALVSISSGSKDLDNASAACVQGWVITPDTQLKWKHAIETQRIMIRWKVAADDLQSAKGLATIGWPHTCADYYPAAEIKNRTLGTTRVGFIIKTEGHVSEVHVVQSSGNANLDAAAVECAKTWRYLPASKDGKPIEVPWQAEVSWKASPPAAPAAQ